MTFSDILTKEVGSFGKGRCEIKDVGSLNGTDLNGHRLKVNESQPLQVNDQVGFGSSTAKVLACLCTSCDEDNFELKCNHCKSDLSLFSPNSRKEHENDCQKPTMDGHKQAKSSEKRLNKSSRESSGECFSFVCLVVHLTHHLYRYGGF